MLAIVAAIAPGVIDFAAGNFESGGHLLISKEPIASVNVEVVGTVLEKDADGFGFGFANQRGIFIAAAQPDKSADGSEDAAELVGALPGSGEGADGAGTGASDGVVVAIGA